jgi:hypothetical protein
MHCQKEKQGINKAVGQENRYAYPPREKKIGHANTNEEKVRAATSLWALLKKAK